MNSKSLDAFTISLDRVAHQWAAKFAAGQTSIGRGKRVYLNTLAVCAVRQYLSCICELEIDLRLGDSWQIELQCLTNIADLVIPNVGKIECIPVLPHTERLELSPDIGDDRIGYVFVQFGEHLDRVEIIGFIDRLPSEPIDLTDVRLQSLDELIELIYTRKTLNIRDFLAGILGGGWESIDSLNIVTNRQFATRNTLDLLGNSSYDSIRKFTCSKMIDLRAQIGNVPLLILLGLSEEPDARIEVKVRLHAAGGSTLLPPDLKLILQDCDGDILSEVRYAQPMNFIQLQSFKLQPGTQFQIRVELDNYHFTELLTA
jgi:hypothetical protein